MYRSHVLVCGGTGCTSSGSETLISLLQEELKKNGVKRVEKGVFGADMKVSLINDGPVTICFDTDVWSGK